MELIYSMRRKALKCEPPQFESVTDHDVVRPICTISNGNIIAFSSLTELTDCEGDTWGGHVYICDMDTPWNTHKVTSTTYPISVLEWDFEGKQLLVGTTVGEVTVFTQRDHLLNEWTCLYTANISGEHIISALFFHNGRRVVSLDKKPDAPITDRLQLLRSSPTLKGFGGTPLEGALVITATGLICAITPPASSDSTQAQLSTDCLRPNRDHIITASMAHKNGSVVVAGVCATSGAAGRGVRAAAVRVSPAGGVVVAPLPALPAPHDSSPVSLSWWHREEPDALLVVGSTLSLWKCIERPRYVHKLLSKGTLQGSTTPGGGPKPGTDCVNTLTWQKAWSVEGHAGAVGVACARSPLGAQVALLATQRALHLIPAEAAGDRYLCSRAVITTGGVGSNLTETGATPSKKAKYGSASRAGGPALCAVQLSPLGAVAVALDSRAQLHLYRLPQPWADIPSPLAISHASNLLEYALVSGIDCLDVLVTLKQSLAELVYERLTETFQRQPATFQQYYFHSWLKLRIALCRSIPSAQSCVSWLTCLQSLQSAWATVAGALRQDDKLADLLDEHTHDVDKSLLSLESKCDGLTSEAAVLSPLRLPLQRALDISLTALMSLCHQQHLMHHSYELWADSAGVQLMRKLCGVARVTGRTADPVGRVLTKLAAGPPYKPDLIEECAGVVSSWGGARVWESLPRCTVSSPHGASWPLCLEYGVEPEALRYIPEPPPYAQCETTPSLTMDSIRYMYLGGGARLSRWRACGRCGARALAAPPPARAPALAAHDARFLPACRCGGKWTLFSNV